MVVNKVFTIGGAKGGVGKTTTSINLGAMLAAEGYSVAAIEMDLAMPNFVDFLGIDLNDTDTTIYDVLAGEAPIEAATYETDSGLTVVPSTPELHDDDRTDLGRFPQIVERLRWHHDIILIDTPAGRSPETSHAFQVADSVLIVSTPRLASLRNARNTIELAARNDADVCGLILNKSGSGTSPGIDKIANTLALEPLGHVPEDDGVAHAQDRGQPIMAYAPNSGPAIAYRKIADKLLDTTEPASDNEGSNTDQANETDSASNAEHESVEKMSESDNTPPEDMSSADGPPVEEHTIDDEYDDSPADSKSTGSKENTTTRKAKNVIDKYVPKIRTDDTESDAVDAVTSNSGPRADDPEESNCGTANPGKSD